MNAYTVAALMISRHEGRRETVYFDTKGIPTIGVGRNLQKGLSPDEIDMMFRNDMNEAFANCRVACPTFDGLSDNRQAALLDMAFNMGLTRLRTFKKMLAAIAASDWQKVYDECLDSKWRQDVGEHRATEVATLLLKG